VTDAATVRRVATRFAFETASITPIGRGHINETFAVETARGDYVVQRVNRVVFQDVVGMTANMLTVRRHLSGAAAGQLVPEPVAAPNGAWIVHEGEDVWRAWRRVLGAEPATEVSPAIAMAAGELLGRFHAGLADLDPGTVVETMPGFHDPGRRLQALRDAIARDPYGRVSTVEPEIAMAFAAAPLVEMATELATRVPRRVAHNDAKLDNTLFRNGAAVCIVDLDTIMPGAWFWDIGDLLRTASTTAAEDEPRAERVAVDSALYDATVAGYLRAVSTGSVDAAELEAVGVAGAIVTYEQAVRFLTDWIAGDVYYRTARPGQNRDRARVQFRLLASMPGPVRRS
jgi:Ser/Thr protein kinase RdoA (MazF antagonist)